MPFIELYSDLFSSKREVQGRRLPRCMCTVCRMQHYVAVSRCLSAKQSLRASVSLTLTTHDVYADVYAVVYADV